MLTKTIKITESYLFFDFMLETSTRPVSVWMHRVRLHQVAVFLVGDVDVVTFGPNCPILNCTYGSP